MNTTDYQFAYKAGFQTSLYSFLVAETISYYRSRGSNVYISVVTGLSKYWDLTDYGYFRPLIFSLSTRQENHSSKIGI